MVFELLFTDLGVYIQFVDCFFRYIVWDSLGVQPLLMFLVKFLQVINGNLALPFPGSLFNPLRTCFGIALDINHALHLRDVLHFGQVPVAREVGFVL